MDGARRTTGGTDWISLQHECMWLHRGVLCLIVILLFFLTGCGLLKPNIALVDLEVDWKRGTAGYVSGRVLNSGWSAKYVEIGVKVTRKGDANYVYSTGWTNLTSVGRNESRPISIWLSGELPEPGQTVEWHWRWSTEAFGASY